jgi:hypothetical protein
VSTLLPVFLLSPRGGVFILIIYSNEKALKSVKDNVAHAQERLYPTVSSPVLPTTLALKDYVGRYTHPVYPAFTVSLVSDPTPYLIAYSMDIVETKLKLTHVSGDFFTAEVKLFQFCNEPVTVSRVQFQVDVEGIPKFGADLDFDSDTNRCMIWFERFSHGPSLNSNSSS